MVSKVDEAMKKKRQQQQQQEQYIIKGTTGKENAAELLIEIKQQQQQQQKQQQIVVLQCNKGRASKFKRSTSNLEEDGVSSAILLLAAIACTPSYL